MAAVSGRWELVFIIGGLLCATEVENRIFRLTAARIAVIIRRSQWSWFRNLFLPHSPN